MSQALRGEGQQSKHPILNKSAPLRTEPECNTDLEEKTLDLKGAGESASGILQNERSRCAQANGAHRLGQMTSFLLLLYAKQGEEEKICDPLTAGEVVTKTDLSIALRAGNSLTPFIHLGELLPGSKDSFIRVFLGRLLW